MATTKKEPKAESNSKTETPSKLYRSETNKVIAGVAGGLGEYFNIDPTIIRIIFILLTVFGGSGLLIYIVLWLVIPSQSQANGISSDTIRSNIDDMKNTTQSFAHNIRSGKQSDNSKFWWAVLIIVLGFMFLLNNYGFLENLDLERLWPLVLIIFGLAIILKK